MSKTVYLIAPDGDVAAFGAGCGLFAFTNESDPFDDSPDITPAHGVRVAVGPCVWVVSRHDSPELAKAAVQVWLQAIIGAPDGALLRWDSERECVVDELAEDEDVFAVGFRDSEGEWFRVHEEGDHFKAAVRRNNGELREEIHGLKLRIENLTEGKQALQDKLSTQQLSLALTTEEKRGLQTQCGALSAEVTRLQLACDTLGGEVDRLIADSPRLPLWARCLAAVVALVAVALVAHRMGFEAHAALIGGGK